ncbi:MAG TPA: glycine cleavage system protein GcvH [Acidimicrobiales bacterium]|jgi:glycine cleavage system H protein|nr:glycine cleavage system protein GcvH [Acidimicrobiales bacterium]|tara:strand:- start:295 stop:675 length:381 start_codon:yes stop_codon:yes gene_type:complete
MNVPENLMYTGDHEWVLVDGNKGKIGITDYAQDALGDVVFVDPPNIGENVSSGQTVSEVESTKSVSDIYAPLTGKVVEVNSELDDSPELLNSDPYGEGWIFIMEITDQTSVDALLAPEQYRELIEG